MNIQYKTMMIILGCVVVLGIVCGLAFRSATHATKVGWSQRAAIGSQSMIFQETCVKGHLILVGGYSESVSIAQLWENTPKGPQPIDCQ